MEQEMLDIFDGEIVNRAAERFGVDGNDLIYIGGFQNFVYEYRLNGKSYILRFTPSSHRSIQAVEAELEWIIYLAENGISVSKPTRSVNGTLTEKYAAKDVYFTAAAFEKSEGKKIDYPDCLNDNALYENLGRMTGRMHSLSKKYTPQNSAIRRHDWNQNYYLQHIGLLPASQKRILERYEDLVVALNRLPREIDSFGLIHGDIGVGNFLVNEQGIITLFDFDEAQYSWFVEDIAIQLYYLVYVYGGEEGKVYREEQAVRFMEHFMRGYRAENVLDDEWLTTIPLFLQLRELIVYIGAFRNYDGDETFSSSDNQWFKDWIAESRERLENGIPIVDIWGG